MSAKTNEEAREILARFSRDVARHYGAALTGVYLFGSRARGDFQLESDADVAVVLRGDGLDFWREQRAITDIAYDYLLDTGLFIQPMPFSDSDWAQPPDGDDLVRAAKRDGIPLLAAA